MRNKSSGEKLSIGPLFFCVSYDALFFFLLFLKLMHCQHFHFIAFSGDFSIPALSFLLLISVFSSILGGYLLLYGR